MEASRKRALFRLLFAICLLSAPMAARANSAEPPRLIVIVEFPPEDLEISLVFEDGTEYAPVRVQKAWETQHRFFNMYFITPPGDTFVLRAAWGGEVFDSELPVSVLGQYNNVLSLDLSGRKVTDGQTLARSVGLVSMRVILTLIIEGFLFFLFKYRDKRSWILFILVNLITQGALNIGLNLSFFAPYPIIGLIFFEPLIFAAEAVVLTIALKEHRRRRAVGFALMANLCSLLLGGLLITYLPI